IPRARRAAGGPGRTSVAPARSGHGADHRAGYLCAARRRCAGTLLAYRHSHRGRRRGHRRGVRTAHAWRAGQGRRGRSTHARHGGHAMISWLRKLMPFGGGTARTAPAAQRPESGDPFVINLYDDRAVVHRPDGLREEITWDVLERVIVRVSNRAPWA